MEDNERFQSNAIDCTDSSVLLPGALLNKAKGALCLTGVFLYIAKISSSY